METVNSKEKKIEYNDNNKSNISKTRDNINIDSNGNKDYYNEKSESCNPKPLILKIKRNNNFFKQISSDNIPSNNVYLDYQKNKDINIVKKDIFDFENSSGNPSNQSNNISINEYNEYEQKIKTHNN